jgi:cellulose biosynthesis protein BcsQ
LVDYLISFQAAKFSVNSFTEERYLLEYLQKCEKTPDIVLASEDFYDKVRQNYQGLIIILVGGKTANISVACKTINKYQYGDRLVADIVKIYSEEGAVNSSLSVQPLNTKKTRIIGIYSPVGGVGKTTIAVGASIQSAWEGKNIFYLNLENMSSTPLYFTGEQNENLSQVLYFLKNKGKSLSLQIEGAKCVDPQYNINYFQPPDSILDFNEDVSEELTILLRELKGSNQYHRIFVDMSSEINRNNLAVLRACDDIILVAQQNMASTVKIKYMLNELQLIRARENWDIMDKFKLVINKYALGSAIDVDQITFDGQENLLKIPFVEGLTLIQGEVYRLDLNSSFGKAMHELLLNF